MSESFHVNSSFSGPVVLEKISKIFVHINTCKIIFPYCGLIRPPRTKIFTNLLLYFMNISAFLAQWFLKRFSNDPTPFLHFCHYLPFEEDLALLFDQV
jgi:hypothetical protein